MEKYGVKSNYAVSAFKKQIEPSYTSTLKAIDNQQRGEMEKYTANQDSVDFTNTVNQMIRNPQDIAAMYGGYMQRAGARAAGLGVDPTAEQAWKQGQTDKIADSVLQPMAENNDYENALNAIAFLKSMGASAGTLNKYGNVFRRQKDVKIAGSALDQALTKDPSLIFKSDEEITNAIKPMLSYQNISANDIGNRIAEFAEKNYTIGDQWMGTVTKDPTIQCDSWTADVYKRVGLFPDGKITQGPSDFGNAYHEAGDGYKPQPGDFIDGQKHVGIYLGNNRYIARNSSGGIHIGTMEEWKEYFGEPIGYGSVAEAAGEGGTSPEVAAARMESTINEALSQAHRRRQAADQQNQQTMRTVRDTIASMRQSGADNQTIYNYLSDMNDMNPNLKYSDAFGNLKLNYSGASRTSSGSSGGTGQAMTKMSAVDIMSIEALIGNGLNNQDDLSQLISHFVSEGKILSDSALVSLHNKMDDYEHGTGKYAIKIETSKAEVASSMGINSKDISDMDYNVAKSQTQEWAIQYNNENGRYPSQVEVLHTMQNMLAMDKLGGTEKTSNAHMGASGIEYIQKNTAMDNDLKEVRFHGDTRVYRLTDEQIDDVLKGKASPMEADGWDAENRRS